MKRCLGILLALLPIVVAVPLLGCPPPLPPGAMRPPSAPDLRALDLVIAEASARGLNVQGRCMEEREDRFVIVVADDATMQRGVGYCASQGDICLSTASLPTAEERFYARAEQGCLLGKCVSGATTWAQDDVWPLNLGRWRVEMYVSAYVDERTHANVVVHEAVHWILSCAAGGADHGHATPGMWGGAGSLEGTVQAALAAELP